MPESNVIASIQTRLINLKGLEARLEYYLANHGTYKLKMVKMRNRVRYYAVSKEKNRKIYLGRDKESDLSRLSVKLYKENLLLAARKEIELLEDFSNKYDGLDGDRVEDVFSSLPSEIKKYVSPDSFTDEGYARLWSEQSFIQAKRNESHRFKVNDRTVVRSKSEYMIAQILEKKGIPYRYEERLVLDPNMGIIYYPDFTILDKRSRRIIYWEHLGRLGDEHYCIENIQKLDDYADHGIIQGKNLILTCECASKPLTTKMIERLIKEFFG